MDQSYVEFAATRLDLKKMGSCLWRVTNAASPFAGLVMTMKGVKGASAALAATLVISVTKVRY